MFDRFIRHARARRALRQQRWEEVLQLVADPLIAGERRSLELRDAAQQALLERARHYLAAGDLAAAKLAIAALGRDSRPPETAELEAALAAAQAAQQQQQELLRKGLDAARDHLRQGRPEAAAAELQAMPAGHVAGERQQLAQLLQQRQRQAAQALQEAAAALQAQSLPLALALFGRAHNLAPALALADPVLPDLLRAAAAATTAQVELALQRQDLAAALHALRSAVESLPPLREAAALQPLLQRLLRAVESTVSNCGSRRDAEPWAQALLASPLPLPEPLQRLLRLLQQHPVDCHTAAADLAALQAAAQDAGGELLAAAVAAELAAEQAVATKLLLVRQQIAAGELEAAQELLATMLAQQPLHPLLRRESATIERSLREREQRLQQARDAAAAGELQQAVALAAALVGKDRLGSAAQLLVTDLQAQLAVVERGIHEVRAALHGRSAGSMEGLRHCLERLQQLAKVQSDHPGLVELQAAVAAELQGLAALASLRNFQQHGDCAPDGAVAVRERIAAVLALRPQLLQPGRLDAPLLECLDAAVRAAEQALVGGDLPAVAAWAALLAASTEVRQEFAATAAALQQRSAAQQQRALQSVAAARAALAERNLALASEQAEQAELAWRDGEEVQHLRRSLQQLRQQAAAADRIADLQQAGDLGIAASELAALPATPPYLRTRIYELKQGIARAQGLDSGFLLRVDEGGEFLVLRGETITIGNLRKRVADLPVLAALAGRHASIRRSMSFHGGMQDRIVAEEGELRFAGAAIRERRLQHGDRIELGSALSLSYAQPTRRSLSVALQLHGGFRVAGTDRLLLLKDRGRDGRLLLGAAPDVHVRVASATGEVELFSNPNGQMVVACATGGTLDGTPFAEQHPVAAGQVVAAAGIVFQLVPYSPG